MIPFCFFPSQHKHYSFLFEVYDVFSVFTFTSGFYLVCIFGVFVDWVDMTLGSVRSCGCLGVRAI